MNGDAKGPLRARLTPDDPLLVINDEHGRQMLAVRRAKDGQAGEVVISTPTMQMVLRVPEIVRAFDVPEVPAALRYPSPHHGTLTPAEVAALAAPWTRVELV